MVASVGFPLDVKSLLQRIFHGPARPHKSCVGASQPPCEFVGAEVQEAFWAKSTRPHPKRAAGELVRISILAFPIARLIGAALLVALKRVLSEGARSFRLTKIRYEMPKMLPIGTSVVGRPPRAVRA